jgi:Zn-finger nucleic acid-binding protein
MDCPVCEEPLIVVERESIELDHCPWCRGLWFDTGELELLAERFEGVAGPDIAALQPVATAEKARRCPRCSARMDKVRAGQVPEVLLDRCPKGHGLWFDHGELGALLSQLGGGVAVGATEMVSFLGETFAAVVAGGVSPRNGSE